jgi:hypothetical protein
LLNCFIGKSNIAVSSTEGYQRASRIAFTVIGGVVIGVGTNSISLELSWCGEGKHFVDRAAYLIKKILFRSWYFQVSGKNYKFSIQVELQKFG